MLDFEFSLLFFVCWWIWRNMKISFSCRINKRWIFSKLFCGFLWSRFRLSVLDSISRNEKYLSRKKINNSKERERIVIILSDDDDICCAVLNLRWWLMSECWGDLYAIATESIFPSQANLALIDRRSQNIERKVKEEKVGSTPHISNKRLS